MVLLYYSEPKEKICLQFFPCKNFGEDTSLDYVYNQWSLTIDYQDYHDLLLEYLKGIYPIVDPTNNERIDSFDQCFDNWIGKGDWLKIKDEINVKIGRNKNRPPKIELEFYWMTWNGAWELRPNRSRRKSIAQTDCTIRWNYR